MKYIKHAKQNKKKTTCKCRLLTDVMHAWCFYKTRSDNCSCAIQNVKIWYVNSDYKKTTLKFKSWKHNDSPTESIHNVPSK